MISTEYRNYYRMITQPDHADLSGQFAAKWGNEDFLKPEPYLNFVTMAGVHDNGWWDWDIRPKIDAEGKPMNFYQIDRQEWADGNAKGIDNYAPHDTYGSLILNMHFTGLPQQRYGTEPSMKTRKDDPEIAKFIEVREADATRLKTQLTVSPKFREYVSQEKLWHNYLLQQVMDRLSLYFCCNYPLMESILDPVPTTWGKTTKIAIAPSAENGVTMSPCPFSEDPLPVNVRVRLVPKRRYRDDDDLRLEFLNAPRKLVEFEIRGRR